MQSRSRKVHSQPIKLNLYNKEMLNWNITEKVQLNDSVIFCLILAQTQDQEHMAWRDKWRQKGLNRPTVKEHSRRVNEHI